MAARDREWEVPPTVQAKARVAGAEGWLDELPQLIAALEAEWELTVGAPYADGTEAFVAPVTQADGSEAVLKLVMPATATHGSADSEIEALRLADGSGCARLLRSDLRHGALLLERLGRPLSALALPLDTRLDILCATVSQVWRPAPGCTLPTGAEKGRSLIDAITQRWEALDHPCSARAVDHALACAHRRIEAHDHDRAVLVHGDVHQWNALEAGDGFKLVDPDGLLAEPEYDLGVLMREDPLELLDGDPRERARWLAARTGFDEVAIWEWGVVERVSTGLVCAEIDLQPIGRQMLMVADQVAVARER